MLDVPGVFVLHHGPFAFAEYFGAQSGHVGFVAELADGREKRFEVEDDRAREREPAQRLPVHPQVDAG